MKIAVPFGDGLLYVKSVGQVKVRPAAHAIERWERKVGCVQSSTKVEFPTGYIRLPSRRHLTKDSWEIVVFQSQMGSDRGGIQIAFGARYAAAPPE